MLYNKLLSFKSEYSNIDNEKFKTFINIINNSNIKFKVSNSNKVNLKSKKNNFNIILNKITLENYQEILVDEITKKNINLNNINNLITLLLEKIINDGKFMECNVKFLIDISKLLKEENSFYLNLINEKFNEILKMDNELIKENYYYFITKLVENNFFKKNIIDEILNFLKNDYKYIYDLYLLFNYNNNLIEENNELIKEKLEDCKKNGNFRYMTLYENLFKSKVKILKSPKSKPENKLKSKCENIIKEYILIEDFEEIKFHLEDNNNDDFKNQFIESIIYEILISEDEDINKLYLLMKSIIFKNNFNKINKKNIILKFNNDDIFLDYKEKMSKIKNILK